MSDNWLDHGHGRDPSHLPSVLSRAPSGPGDAAGPGAGPTRAGLMSRVSGPWFVAIVTAVVTLGSAGAAYAIRETLFPGLGAPTPQSVWQNPAPAEEPLPPSTSTTSSSSTTSSTSTSTTVVDDDVAALDTPAPTEPSLSTPPNVTVDDHGGGTGSGHDDGPSPPAPSVTTAPVTTVDDHGGGPDPGDDDGSGSSGGSGSGSGSGSGDNSGSSSGSGSGGGSDDTGPDD